MPRQMQRAPFELGLQLNINRLVHDGLIQPGEVAQPSSFHWHDESGERAAARIEAN